MLEAALDAIIVMDGSGAVIEWNPAAEELFGWSRTDAIGAQLGDLIIPDELREAHRTGLAHYLATGEGPALNTRLTLPGQRRDGSRLTVELTISPSTSEDGPLFTGWLRDITELEEARTAVARSEERLASLVANVNDIITVMGPDARWISSSGAGTRLLGYDLGFEPEGGIFSLLHPDDVERAQAAFVDVIDGTRSVDEPIDLRVRALDGTYHVLETVAQNLIDDPAVEGLVLTSRDVTEQRIRAAALRRTTSQLSALVASLGDGVLFVDAEGRIVFTNDAFCSTFGYAETPQELVGAATADIRSHAEGLMTDAVAFGRRIDERMADGLTVFGDELELTDGRFLERDYIPIPLEENVGHLWLYRDITARRALEATRERLLEVERGLRERAEDQARSLREIADLKTELVAMVSHELRTPLTSIVSFADLLLTGDDAPDPEESQEFVRVIDRNAKRLIRLVDDLLLLGQLESGVITIEPRACSVSEIVDWAVQSGANMASDAGIDITTSITEGPPLYADPGRLGQVLDNLLSNAIKYSPNGTRVEVTADHGRDGWTIAVVDDGPGIAAESQTKLFDTFFRAESTSRTTQGTGLGLPISKAIVELHEGTIRVDSTVGEGSRFEITIPDRTADDG